MDRQIDRQIDWGNQMKQESQHLEEVKLKRLWIDRQIDRQGNPMEQEPQHVEEVKVKRSWIDK